jgi:hypothetical protein
LSIKAQYANFPNKIIAKLILSAIDIPKKKAQPQHAIKQDAQNRESEAG